MQEHAPTLSGILNTEGLGDYLLEFSDNNLSDLARLSSSSKDVRHPTLNFINFKRSKGKLIMGLLSYTNEIISIVKEQNYKITIEVNLEEESFLRELLSLLIDQTNQEIQWNPEWLMRNLKGGHLKQTLTEGEFNQLTRIFERAENGPSYLVSHLNIHASRNEVVQDVILLIGCIPGLASVPIASTLLLVLLIIHPLTLTVNLSIIGGVFCLCCICGLMCYLDACANEYYTAKEQSFKQLSQDAAVTVINRDIKGIVANNYKGHAIFQPPPLQAEGEENDGQIDLNRVNHFPAHDYDKLSLIHPI